MLLFVKENSDETSGIVNLQMLTLWQKIFFRDFISTTSLLSICNKE